MIMNIKELAKDSIKHLMAQNTAREWVETCAEAIRARR
jgi:hypothetical protein